MFNYTSNSEHHGSTQISAWFPTMHIHILWPGNQLKFSYLSQNMLKCLCTYHSLFLENPLLWLESYSSSLKIYFKFDKLRRTFLTLLGWINDHFFGIVNTMPSQYFSSLSNLVICHQNIFQLIAIFHQCKHLFNVIFLGKILYIMYT